MGRSRRLYTEGPPSCPKTTHTNTYFKHALCLPVFRHHTHKNTELGRRAIWEWKGLNLINSIWSKPASVSTDTAFLYPRREFRRLLHTSNTVFMSCMFSLVKLSQNCLQCKINISGKHSYHCELRFNVTCSEHDADFDLSASCHVSHITHISTPTNTIGAQNHLTRMLRDGK